MPKPMLELEIPDGPVAGHRTAVAHLREHLARGYTTVHAHGLRAGIDAALAARGTPTRVVVTVHNLVRPETAGRIRAPVYARAEKLVVKLASRVFAVSEEIAGRLRRARGAGDKVEVLYLGVGEAPAVRRAREEIREELGVGSAALVVTAARLAPQKSLHVLIDAVAELGPKVHVAIAGQGPLQDDLARRAAERGVSDRVRFLGFVSDLPDYIAAADAFCLSSSWEGIPLAVQEAVLLGTPVVATAVGGMPEVIEDGRSGRLVPAGDPLALAGALDEVLRDPRDYAANALDHLRRRFSTERMLDRLRAEYEA